MQTHIFSVTPAPENNSCRTTAEQAVLHGYKRKTVISGYGDDDIFLGFEPGGFQLVVSKIAADFSLSGFEMGWMVAAQYIAIIVMPLLLGGLSDRVGKKCAFVAFLVVFIAGCAVVVASPSSGGFILGIFVVGCGYCICESTSSAALTDRYGERSHKQLNLVQCCFSLGAVRGPLPADWIMTRFRTSWRTVFVLAGAAYLLLLPLLLFTKISRSPAPARGEKVAATPRAPRLLTSPIFLCMLASIIIYVGLENGVAYFLDSFFTKELSAGTMSALSISLFWLSMAGSRLAIGIFAFSKRILVICFGASAGLLALLTAVRVPIPSLVICCLIGALFGPVWPRSYRSPRGNIPGIRAVRPTQWSRAAGSAERFHPSCSAELWTSEA